MTKQTIQANLLLAQIHIQMQNPTDSLILLQEIQSNVLSKASRAEVAQFYLLQAKTQIMIVENIEESRMREEII